MSLGFLQTRTDRADENARNAALSVTTVLWHALHLAEPSQIANNRRAHGVPYVEIPKMFFDIRREVLQNPSRAASCP